MIIVSTPPPTLTYLNTFPLFPRLGFFFFSLGFVWQCVMVHHLAMYGSHIDDAAPAPMSNISTSKFFLTPKRSRAKRFTGLA